jgi:cell cycle sensor histidine kinase DivJ
MRFTAVIRDYLDAQVHPAAAADPVMRAQHRSFIAARLVGAVTALAMLPVWLVWRGGIGLVDLVLVLWLVAPLGICAFLSRTGRLEAAHLLSAISMAGLAGMLAWLTGGVGAVAMVWLVIVPLEATLSRSPHLVAQASVIAVVTAVGLLMIDIAGWWPPAIIHPSVFEAAPVAILAVAWGALLAFGLASLQSAADDVMQGSEARYALLAANMTDVISGHASNGAVTFLSPAAERLTGAPLRTLAGQGLFDRVHVADRPAYLTALAEAAHRGEAVSVEFRLRVCRPASGEDEFIWVEMRCRPIDDETDGARNVVSVMRDISDRKAHDALLEEARVAAEQASAAKSRFLAVMSHELRTPLNAIIGFSDMLANEELLRIEQARRLEYAGLINESGQHLLSVVNGLLDMSKIETGKFELILEPFDLAPVVARVTEILGLKAREGDVILAAQVAQDLPEIVADKRALTQIMLNLLSNAVKFTRPGGRVDIAAARIGDRVRLTVADTGIGVAPEDLARLGDAFFQARNTYDRPYEGTGLGLSVVKGLVELHGGKIGIESTVGAGTTVTVILPVDCEAARAATSDKTTGIVADLRPRARPDQVETTLRKSA